MTWYLTRLLLQMRERGEIPYPSNADFYIYSTIRGLWLNHYLWLRGSLSPGQGVLGLTKKGLDWVNAHEEDWPVELKLGKVGD